MTKKKIIIPMKKSFGFLPYLGGCIEDGGEPYINHYTKNFLFGNFQISTRI